MKLLSISLGSWLLGLLSLLLTFFLLEGASLDSANARGVTLVSLIITALLFSLAYAPSLFWLRNRLGGCRPAALFPFASAVVINLPVFLIGILAIGRTLAATEAFAFISAFVLMGAVFGLGFVWNFQNRDIKSGAWRYPNPFRPSQPSGILPISPRS
ncbi:MAG TPA: hypothetical protein VHR36_06090 [Pyrinomonadaceae bacterium]|nr:hypothetical protein [Pyrinomonadaceae bacterium]